MCSLVFGEGLKVICQCQWQEHAQSDDVPYTEDRVEQKQVEFPSPHASIAPALLAWSTSQLSQHNHWIRNFIKHMPIRWGGENAAEKLW